MQISDALCARICHDLSSPLGTLIGAIELVADDGFASEALPLATETAVAMGHRLRLLRAAWAGDCGALAPADLSDLACGLPPRIRLDASQLPPRAFAAAMSRVLVNLMLLAAEALPRGGTIRMIGDADVIVMLEGPGAAWPDSLLEALAEPGRVSLDDPRAAPAPVMVMLAHAAGLQVSILLAPGLEPSGPPPIRVGLP
jgi:histidine phosphotransferase ChpT